MNKSLQAVKIQNTTKRIEIMSELVKHVGELAANPVFVAVGGCCLTQILENKYFNADTGQFETVVVTHPEEGYYKFYETFDPSWEKWEPIYERVPDGNITGRWVYVGNSNTGDWTWNNGWVFNILSFSPSNLLYRIDKDDTLRSSVRITAPDLINNPGFETRSAWATCHFNFFWINEKWVLNWLEAPYASPSRDNPPGWQPSPSDAGLLQGLAQYYPVADGLLEGEASPAQFVEVSYTVTVPKETPLLEPITINIMAHSVAVGYNAWIKTKDGWTETYQRPILARIPYIDHTAGFALQASFAALPAAMAALLFVQTFKGDNG